MLLKPDKIRIFLLKKGDGHLKLYVLHSCQFGIVVHLVLRDILTQIWVQSFFEVVFLDIKSLHDFRGHTKLERH